jgi:hypothetical protein
MMTPDQTAILEYLKASPRQFFSVREIGKRVGGKTRFAEEPDWARPLLKRLAQQGKVETDSMNRYRFKPEEPPAKGKFRVAPKIAEILKSSGKVFPEVILLDLDEEMTPPEKKSPPPKD